MSAPCIIGTPTGGTLAFGTIPMIVHKMGNGYSCADVAESRKALIPVEVGEPTLQFYGTNEEANNEALLVKLELLDERKDLAHGSMVAQKKTLERYYNCRANLYYFKVGDLVLRKVTQNTQEINVGKLGPTWEGPYRILTITGKGSYELENQDGVKLLSNWNVTHLKMYYC
ncbi:uncharacterized protein LOC142172406 [Nicotiana tabacum]|uniref:Uncharacterized protein LOC142172406 n=1 Tax=Nicotiana tabacum TaxID=4097 RepID=A0AC58T4F8_TOBAC